MGGGGQKHTKAQLPLCEFEYATELGPDITLEELINVEENLAMLRIDPDETEPSIIQDIGTQLRQSVTNLEFNRVAVEKECRIECSRLKAKFITDIVILFSYASPSVSPLELIDTVFENEADTDYVNSIRSLFPSEDPQDLLIQQLSFPLVLKLFRRWSKDVVFEDVPPNQASNYLLKRNDVIAIWGEVYSEENTDFVARVFSSVNTFLSREPYSRNQNATLIRSPRIIVQINGENRIVLTITPEILFTTVRKSQFYFIETRQEVKEHILISQHPPEIQRTRFILLYRAMLCHFAERQFRRDQTFTAKITQDDINQFITDVSTYDPRTSGPFNPGVAVALDIERLTRNIYHEPLIQYFKSTQPEEARDPESIRKAMLQTAKRMETLLQFAKLNPALRIRYKNGFIKPYTTGNPQES